ncbi:hypothetical protein [Methylocella silvestris]|uniref:Uncharacterized protein n=1 Tax=Methylocella silvestris TaxID=199596 RepID=A0A2J7TM91_METSI|nr:hypothetical protein [Methylocella silvestris]PNG27892.1 hypothetical protein CR492_03110 [Methylocella silvestris]
MKRWRRQGENGRGRPRKQYALRYVSGATKKPTVAERTTLAKLKETEVDQKSVAVAQPHRLGSDNRLLESPLGLVVLRHCAPRELWTRGCDFALKFYAWTSAIGAGGNSDQQRSVFWSTENTDVEDDTDDDQKMRVSQRTRLLVDRFTRARWESFSAEVQRVKRPYVVSLEIVREAIGVRGSKLLHRLCVEELSIDNDADQLLVLKGLAALHLYGPPLHRDAPSFRAKPDIDEGDATSIYTKRVDPALTDKIALLKAVFNIGGE